MLKRFLSSICVLTLMGAVAIVALLGSAQRYLDAPVDLSAESVVWTVQKGSSLNHVNRQLFKANIVNHPKLLSLFARLTGNADIQAGQYRISSEDTATTILHKFNRGDVISYQITFPEGWAFKQWLEHLSKVEQFASISEFSQIQIMSAAGIEQQHPEGWLFPDTYSYTSSDSAIQLLARAHLKMKEVLQNEWLKRPADSIYDSAYDVLIMASIVEKETGLAEERPAIAGVFVRRLQKGMRLQTDPTVIYGLGDAYQGNIKRSHLKTLTPYNTYMIKGLPPTPIAMPSAAAIHATLHPQAGTSYYFVARGDGGHYFSDTLKQHQKAVRKYQIYRRAVDYQSSPTLNKAVKTVE